MHHGDYNQPHKNYGRSRLQPGQSDPAQTRASAPEASSCEAGPLFMRLVLAFVSAPVLMIPQIEALVMRIQRGTEEEKKDPQVPHLLEAPVGGEDATTHDGELSPRDFLAEQIILGKLRFFVKSAEFVEALAVKQHEHPSRKWLMDARQILEEIAAPIKNLVGEASLTQNVGGGQMKLL